MEELRPEERLRIWGFKFVGESPDIQLPDNALKLIDDICRDYYVLKNKLVAFFGNYVYGNIVANYIIERLLTENKISGRAVRQVFDPDSSVSEGEVIFIDNVGFDGMSPRDKRIFNEHIEGYTSRAKLVILNIPEAEDFDALPKSLYDELQFTGQGIQFKSLFAKEKDIK